MIFFSVIIPVYNKKPHIQRSIDSVLNQSYRFFELIIIDDASCDGSFEIINSYSDERIRVFQRKTPGPGGYSARNLGITKAKFDWIAFLDADDEWVTEKLEICYQEIIKNPQAAFISSGWNEFISEGKIFPDPYFKKNYNQGTHEIRLLDFFTSKVPIWTSVFLVKKEHLITCNGFNENYRRGADQDLWLRLLYLGISGIWINKITATYYRNSVNMVTKTEKHVEIPMLNTLDELISKNPELKKNRPLITFYNKLVYLLAKIELRNGGSFVQVIKKKIIINSYSINKLLIGAIFLVFVPTPVLRMLIEKKKI